jgi:predicted DsbA family dithiol-disulfide isomerase
VGLSVPGGSIAKPRGVDYNRGVIRPVATLKRFALPMLLAVSWLALAGASCSKKTKADPGADPEGLVKAIDSASGNVGQPGAKAGTPAAAVSHDPVPGIDLGKLDDERKENFFALVDSLPSPCGKAQSLRKSVTEDQSCKRAPFAARYLVLLLETGASLDEAKEYWGYHYDKAPVRTFQLGPAVPVLGPADAPLKIVEFYDYGCPHCKVFSPLLAETQKAYPNDLTLYYKQFPLPGHPDSKGAAQAALAAARQGKFHEMHDMLFANQMPGGQVKSKLDEYAGKIGLDPKKYAADYEAAAPQVAADVAEGEANQIEATPAIFINGREYKGPPMMDFLKAWVDEELAVNR